MISRRRLPAFLLAAALQPYFPTPQPASPPEVMDDAQFQLLAAIILDVHTQSLFNHESRLRRLEWLTPGIDLYQEEEGDV